MIYNHLSFFSDEPIQSWIFSIFKRKIDSSLFLFVHFSFYFDIWRPWTASFQKLLIFCIFCFGWSICADCKNFRLHRKFSKTFKFFLLFAVVGFLLSFCIVFLVNIVWVSNIFCWIHSYKYIFSVHFIIMCTCFYSISWYILCERLIYCECSYYIMLKKTTTQKTRKVFFLQTRR